MRAMAILGLGIDLVQVDRVAAVLARRGERFVDRVYTASEREYCERRGGRPAHWASRFAAKEAVMKVLGTGWARGVRWRDIEVVRAPGGPPGIELHGVAREHAERLGIRRMSLAITHDAGVAAVVAVGESD
jgi:holo-[acyl-carrier protein] synthase